MLGDELQQGMSLGNPLFVRLCRPGRIIETDPRIPLPRSQQMRGSQTPITRKEGFQIGPGGGGQICVEGERVISHLHKPATGIVTIEEIHDIVPKIDAADEAPEFPCRANFVLDQCAVRNEGSGFLFQPFLLAFPVGKRQLGLFHAPDFVLGRQTV